MGGRTGDPREKGRRVRGDGPIWGKSFSGVFAVTNESIIEKTRTAGFPFMASTQIFWSAATCRRFQKARRVVPARVQTIPQTSKKRRPAGALQKIKFATLTDLVPIAPSGIFIYFLTEKSIKPPPGLKEYSIIVVAGAGEGRGKKAYRLGFQREFQQSREHKENNRCSLRMPTKG